jgi:DNA-binding NarL/FixJ family response regulator
VDPDDRSHQITILIVDDHIIAREGLKSMLVEDARFKVVGEALNGDEAAGKVTDLRPDVILMDFKMPVVDGLEATRRIKAEHPNASVVFMTSYDDEALLVNAIRAGACGFLGKDSPHELLLSTVQAAVKGGSLIKGSILQRAFGSGPVGNARLGDTRHPSNVPEIGALTGREIGILRMMADGMTNKAIARKLGFAEITVKKDVQEILFKLSASDRTQATAIAMRLGLIE